MYIQKNINVGVRIDHPSLAITLNVFVFQTADAAICSNHTSFAETNAVAFVHFHETLLHKHCKLSTGCENAATT